VTGFTETGIHGAEIPAHLLHQLLLLRGIGTDGDAGQRHRRPGDRCCNVHVPDIRRYCNINDYAN